MTDKTNDKEDGDKVRCTFELTNDEAAAICEARCEPKPSTAAAQIVRLYLKNGCPA